jgi:methionine-rich copper-binding protein CopC
MKRSLTLWALATLLLTLGLPMTAAAHVHMDKTSPADGAVLSTSPTSIEAWFTGKVNAEWSKIAVSDANGKTFDLDELSNGDNPKHLSVKLQPLDRGTYTVNLNVISGDGHRIKGHFSFTIK